MLFNKQNKYPVSCVDVIVVNDKDEILLAKRALTPAKGRWGVIGGRVEAADNNLEAAARREVKEETGLEIEVTHLAGVLTDGLLADPRFSTVQTIYEAKILRGSLRPTDEASKFKWLTLEKAIREKLVFNHNHILETYKERKEMNKLIPAKRRVFSDYFNASPDFYQGVRPGFAAKAIILNEQKEILLAQRAIKPFVGAWDMPGGHIYADETIKQGLKREVREELNVACEVGELFQIYSDKGQSPKCISCAAAFYFTTINSHNFRRNIEINDFKYFPLNNLPEQIAYHYERVMDDIKDYLGL